MKTIKIGSKVWTKVGTGIVVAKYKRVLGSYWVYDVEIEGKIWTCRNVYLDK